MTAGATPEPAPVASTSAPAQASPRRGWRHALVFVLVALALVVVVVAVRYRAADSPVRRADGDRAAPSFAVEDLRDESSTITLAGLRGRPVVLNFWASWCVPCRKELPAFQAVYRRMDGEVAFLGINHLDGRVDALELLRDIGVRYPSGFDPGGKVAQAYGLYGMPTTVFVSAEGRIVATRTGEMSASQLTEAIWDLFSLRVLDEPRESSPDDRQG